MIESSISRTAHPPFKSKENAPRETFGLTVADGPRSHLAKIDL